MSLKNQTKSVTKKKKKKGENILMNLYKYTNQYMGS